MDDHKKPEPQAEHPEKKISRKTLTFYIIGLFSVAIALILISYIAQVRSDKQLENLSTKLNEQQTVAQDISQKMEDLQKQLEVSTKKLTDVRNAMGLKDVSEEDKGTVESVQALVKSGEAVNDLLLVLEASDEDDQETAKKSFQNLQKKYGLSGSADGNNVFGADGGAIYRKLVTKYAN